LLHPGALLLQTQDRNSIRWGLSTAESRTACQIVTDAAFLELLKIGFESQRGDPRSVADREAVLTHLRRAPINAVFGVPHNRLISAETACAGHYLVAPLFEF
jgi:hypothetical protein